MKIMSSGDIGIWCMMLGFDIGSTTTGFLLLQFGKVARGEELIGLGIFFGWFLVICMVVMWKEKRKEEEGEREREEERQRERVTEWETERDNKR